MKTSNKTFKQRFTALFTAVTMLVSMIPFGFGTIAASAANAELSATAEPVLSNDAVTFDDWQAMFPADSTENAGGVWIDKSVVSGTDELRGQTANAGEFLVGLSAIGSSLDLQSEASTATDTILLLDASSSMGENRSTLNTATNEVIDKLMSLNPNNRVAVVFYSSSASVLLPLGHYEQTRTNTTYNNKYITYSNSTYTVSSGLTKDGTSHTGTSVRTGNGTNQQSAMIEAMNILNGVTDKSRTPIMVLMSDGEASVSNTDYTSGTSGTSISTFYRSGSTQVGVDRVTFFTMLTAAYVKNQVNAQWNNKFHIFSLCFNTDVPLARLLLNPDAYNVSTTDTTITSVQNYWNTYNNEMYADGANVPIGNNPTLNATKSSAISSMHYVDAEGAFEATTGVGSTGLVAAFDKIYEKIVEISELEFVTHVDPIDGANLSGYVSFVDHIGSYMKVGGVRGIMMDGRLYTGENFAEAFYDANSVFGTIANPTELGNEFVRSLRTRLGLYTDDVTLEEANTRTHLLIQNAYDAQQLFYQNGAYSNYFGWYSDENNLCLGPWNDKTDPDGTNYTAPSVTYPGDASKIKYVNKSYLFLGSNSDYNEMYISVRVSRNIYTGEETVAFGIPAALLPIVRYKVIDNDTTGEVTMSYNAGNATPITLFYEVKPGINQDTLSLVDDAYIAENTDSEGNVRFLVSKYKDFTADISNKIETSQIGDNTYSYFKPNYQNRKYYFTADETDVYYEVSSGVYELYTGENTWEEAGNDPNNYFYKETVYKVVSGEVVAEDHYFPLNEHTLIGNNETGEYKAVQRADNSWYIPKGAIQRHMSRFAQFKHATTPSNPDDIYGLLRYLIPFVEDTDTVEGIADTDNYIYACAVLGNNGVATVADTSTGGILLKKEYSDPDFVDDNASFTFTIEASDISTATVYKYKLSHNNMVAEEIGELTFTSNTATLSMKANEAVYIGGLPAGKVVKITENDHPQYITDTVFVNDADTNAKIANITVVDGAYDTVTFKNVIKPETVPVLINYIDEAYKSEVDALTFEGKEEYLALLDGKMITESHYIDSYNSETDPPLINYIRQSITGTIDPYTGKNYVRTDYYIVEDGTDSIKGIVINEYYAIDELDDPDNNETDGDGIPDKYQATAKFDAKENGSVGGVTTQVFTLKDENGNNATSGKIHPLVRNEEYNYNIVTTTPDEGYTFEYWTRDDGTDAVNPQTEITVNAGDVVYFWANFTPDTLDDPDDNTTDGDDIPDKYQATVIFGAKENGTVSGTTTQVFTLTDDGGNYATSGKITPAVTGVVTVTPNEGYAFDIWTRDEGTDSVNPQAEITVNAGDVVYFWANFTPDTLDDPDDNTTDGDDIPDKYQATVIFGAKENGTVSGTTTQVFTLTDDGGNYATSGKITPAVTGVVTVTPNEGYAFDIWTRDNGTDSVNPQTEITVNAGDVIYFWANFTPDMLDDPDDNTTDGDDIPDKYQATVIFGAKENGAVSGTTTQVFTLTDDGGNYATSGKITPAVTGVVTVTPNEGYAFDIWTRDNGTDSVNPQTEITVNAGEVVYFWANFAPDTLDDPDDNTTDGDDIPDKYQATVIFGAKENGAVSGTTTQVFTLTDDGGNYATSGKITPAVTGVVIVTPNEGYAFDIWTRDEGTDAVDPQTEITVNAGDVVYFWANFDVDKLDDPGDTVDTGDDIPDKYQATVIFGAKENGAVSGTTTQVFTLKNSIGNYATSGKITPAVDGVVTVTPDENYMFEMWTMGEGTDAVDPQTEITVNAGDVIYFWANFTPDTLDDPDDNTTDGDDIPDKYQATVIFQAKKNGIVSGTTTQVFTLTDDGGNYATSGKITPLVEGVVTATPNNNYKFSKWTKDDGTASVVPQTEITVNAGDVIIFWANFARTGGGGGPTGGDDPVNGILEITKTVKAPEDFNGSNTYTFVLYKETNGVRSVYENLSVKVGEVNKFSIPVGTYYIEEDESASVAGYTLKTTCDLADSKIEIKVGNTTKVAFENAYTKDNDEPGKDDMLEKDDHYAYIVGYPDGNVRPEGNITRAEVATIFFRMLTDEARAKYYSNESGFSDVNKSDWFNIAISTLVKAEIINGEGGSYRPNDAITRAELCKIAASFYTMKEGNEANFSDISGHWAESFIKSAYEYGFIDGYPDGTFKPDQLVTRAEAMKIVNRTLERIAHKDYMLDDMIKWPDNADKDTWFYADVQEATNSHAYDKNDEHEIWTGILPVRDWTELEVTE